MPPDFFPQFLDPTKPWGAYHIAADPFLFPNPAITLSPDQAALAQQFTDEAVGHARGGDPRAPRTPLWTVFRRRRHDLLRLVPRPRTGGTRSSAGTPPRRPWRRVSAADNVGLSINR